ncbi:MAG: DUF192 domain-containing protein [Kiritimatiellia bacterium]
MNLNEAQGALQLWGGEELLLPRIQVADRFLRRSLGLMGRRDIPEDWGAGLFFPHCRSLHGAWMRFPLEVWFLDAEGQPLGGPRMLSPWGMLWGPRESRHCMEIRPGLFQPPASGHWAWRICPPDPTELKSSGRSVVWK